MTRRQERCRICGEIFDPHQVRQKYCSTRCRVAANRSEKRNKVGVVGRNVTRAPARPTGAVELKEMASDRYLPASAKPCTRPGFPNDIFEARDGAGLPLFFLPDGERLLRIWGPNTIPDFQLHNMGLKRTGLTFPGGEYYVRTTA
jgi:hypothetical protein